MKNNNIKVVIAACDYRLKTINKQPKLSQKFPQVVKHVVKGEKMGLFNPESREEQAFLYIVM